MARLEKDKFTVREAMSLFGKSEATIYNWIRDEKLRAEQTKKGKIVLLTESELENICNEFNIIPNLENKSIIENNNTQQSETILEPVNDQLKFVLEQILEQNNMLLKQNEGLMSKVELYSSEAGQVKLLTDNNKFYQEEYFKIKYELETSQNKVKELEAKLKTTEEELKKVKEQLENRFRLKFWK